MPRICRISDQNALKTSGANIVATSTYETLPVRHLLDQLPSKVWRSATGWTFLTGQNYSIDFNRGGVKNAVIAVGTYATGAEVAVALQAALEAADATPVWSVTYNTSTFKFVISSDIAFVILGGTGPLLGESMLKDLGFSTGSDTGSATSHTASEVSYHSRHAIDVELPSAQSLQAAWVLGHNVAATGVVRFVASEFTLIGNGLDDSPIVGYETDLAGTDVRIAYGEPSFGTFRYFRFILDDVQNPDGYSEVGIAYAGTYRQPAVTYSVSYQEEGDDLSELERATEGALYGVLRPEAPAWALEFLEVADADADLFREHRASTPKGKCFGFGFDVGVDDTDFVYGFRDGPLRIQQANSGVYWTATFMLREALP